MHCTSSKAISSQVKLGRSHPTQTNQNKNRYIFRAIMITSPDSRGNCIPRLPEEVYFSEGRGGSFFLLALTALTAKLPELLPKIYSLDLEVRHLLTMLSLIKDSHVALITTNPPQNEMSGVRLCN